MSDLAMVEIDRYDWSLFPVLGDRSTRVPDSLRKLISAEDEDKAEGFYWELENVVVVQGQLYEAAPPVVAVLMASLVDGVPEGAYGWVLELLLQCVAGESDEEAVERGNPHLGDDCRARAREGLWILYRQLRGRYKDSVKAILDIIEPDESRLVHFTSKARSK